MSRLMHRLAGSVPINTTATVLTVPTGHKYEVLELGYWGTSAGTGLNIAENLYDGSVLVIQNGVGYPAGLFTGVFVHASVCLEAGDQYFVATANLTAAVAYWLTYMDVTL